MIFNKTNSCNLNYLRCELEANEIELFFCGATDPEHKLHWVSGEIVSLTDQIVEEATRRDAIVKIGAVDVNYEGHPSFFIQYYP
ncbi:hypothetical protein FDG72_gp102 [Klebsiella phage PMBT1]|uniref:Uncharacterized protein n=1 Tax=Klebsiella phage PMBT1 TaxID=1880822 RepID=A0A1G4GQM8_9CAUD|nr:hypothetical protein FDG72_gp102 [Klebsiella phage PMBT1]SCO64831.1 hypothetical protein [Klebsiella phage PMBT1]